MLPPSAHMQRAGYWCQLRSTVAKSECGQGGSSEETHGGATCGGLAAWQGLVRQRRTSCSAGTGPFFECQPGCPSPTHLDPCNAAHRCLAWCRKAFAAPAATLPRQSSDVSHIVAYCAWASSREAMHMSARSSTMPMEAHHQQGRTFVLSPQEAMPHSASTKSTTVTDRRMLAHMQQRPQKSSKNTGKFSDTCTDEAALSRARKKCRGQGINLLVAFALSDAADIGITKLITAHRNRMKRTSSSAARACNAFFSTRLFPSTVLSGWVRPI